MKILKHPNLVITVLKGIYLLAIITIIVSLIIPVSMNASIPSYKKNFKQSGDEFGILILSPEDRSTVYLKPGEPLVFRVAIPADIGVRKVTLILCGKPYEMSLAETWGNDTLVYEARVTLPPKNDLYSWKILIVTNRGSLESCTQKTMVIFNSNNTETTQNYLVGNEKNYTTQSTSQLFQNTTTVPNTNNTIQQGEDTSIGNNSLIFPITLVIVTTSIIATVILKRNQ
ncbi:hypothetical protein Smar_0868 [Staphylothermus marinus F1]|uniref:Uncharacterized protein n=1 Tax=Staphylothermus marinus (strain ATCC 43588 / DSM 3639 / JCM 9404 / F1) TaxID=399550 RepID=A3DMV8_STAMF|nr:hypothetical protein [Staphylothermus marinus]ABN69968.1 hypothetical protein Smar_0868 [Staphylothermus marinus F1]